MTTDATPPKRSLGNLLPALSLLAILVGVGYLGSRLHGIEAHLQSLDPGFAAAVRTGPNGAETATGGTVYVPAYSHVYSHGGMPYLLEVTLSVRNASPRSNLTLTRADFYDTQGKLLRSYVNAPRPLAPLETESFVVEKADYEGGSGSNFIVEWNADGPISPPVIEAVMIGIDPQYQISFVRNGVPVERAER